jgi:hypothetical protein
LHKHCNRKKSAQSIPAQAKSKNATYLRLLSGSGTS